MSDATYSEYPITLVHPHFSPSKPIAVPGSQIYDQQGRVTYQDFKGTPQRYPPVTANSVHEEERLKADGYERAGKVDPSAWVMAHSDAPSIDYVPQKYPLWKNGVLILTAQEDPDADPDFKEAASKVAEAAPAQEPSPTANMRAQMEEMNRTMQAMAERIRLQDEENARLKAVAEMQSAEAPKPRGRPRKDA